jgi:actin-related protein
VRCLAPPARRPPADTARDTWRAPRCRYTTWIGGSILASLSTFATMWVTQQDYAADPNVIFKKFS